mgnify:FL=1
MFPRALWRVVAFLVVHSAIAASAGTADHSKFDVLKGPFTTAEDVTEACSTCHTEAAGEVKKTIHWTWDGTNSFTGQRLGKPRIMNSFCGSPISNEPRCTSCHAGYGWTDLRKTPEENGATVDCLACHDGSGTYKKTATDAGHPLYSPRVIGGVTVEPPDLAKAAMSVEIGRAHV